MQKILLNYAELKYELNGGITDEELEKSINLIRARVNMPKLTNAFVTGNGLDMLNEIRRERRVELAFEGEFRYWDLIRWKTAEVELPKAVKGSEDISAGTYIDPRYTRRCKWIRDRAGCIAQELRCYQGLLVALPFQ